jgi:signal transduction histidine kinase
MNLAHALPHAPRPVDALADAGGPRYEQPARRSSAEERLAQAVALASQPLVTRVVDDMPVPAAVLNAQREVLHENAALRALLGVRGASLLGLRLGEAAGCQRTNEGPGGCGTGTSCASCGLGSALSELARTGVAQVEECQVKAWVDGRERQWDLRLRASRLRGVEPAPLYLVVLEDLSGARHQAALGQMFFHDVLNTLSSIQGYLQVWTELPGDQARSFAPDLLRLASRAIDEVQAQRDLVDAESGHLRVMPVPVDVPQLLREVCTTFQRAEEDPFRLQLTVPRLDLPVMTDPLLLRRVVANLVKNALEASEPEQPVTVRWSPVQRRISVHNEGVMPADVQARIFQRTFSTKGDRRGIGTHSVRLLAETYLGGQVDFTSTPEGGTTFRVTLPEVPQRPRRPAPGGVPAA